MPRACRKVPFTSTSSTTPLESWDRTTQRILNRIDAKRSEQHLQERIALAKFRQNWKKEAETYAAQVVKNRKTRAQKNAEWLADPRNATPWDDAIRDAAREVAHEMRLSRQQRKKGQRQ